jgi:hypothetical protein
MLPFWLPEKANLHEIWAACLARESACVESDGPKKLKADIPAGCTDSLFRKSPRSAKAEKMTVRF